MRVFDCVIITSDSDLQLLEVRFTEFENLNVTHVICEAEVTFDKTPKPLHFAESNLWEKYRGRWNHVRVEARELPEDAPAREKKNALREYLARAVNGDPGDIVLHGGVDEIPSEATVQGLISREAAPPLGMEMRWCAYTPNLVHPKPWRGTVVQEWRLVGSFAGLREKRLILPAIMNAGTRLSMLGEEIPGGNNIHPDGSALLETEVDDTYPRWVCERMTGGFTGA